jgi:tRNA-modifying protein YgfZ
MAERIETARDYEAARRGAAVMARLDRRFLEVTGKAPGAMLSGILTGRLPGEPPAAGQPPSPTGGAPWPPGESAPGVETLHGEVSYSAMLTVKGRMITDLRVFRGRDGGFLLDLPEAGLEGTLAQFRKFLPPRLARVEDRSTELAILTVLGPAAPALLAEAVGSGAPPRIVGEDVEALTETRELIILGGGFGEARIVGNGEVQASAWDVVLPPANSEKLLRELEQRGAAPLSPGTWEVLRVEGGRPAFGVDMDERTIPVEAGIHLRAIDYKKGCYTGQEVIIRIRDRGKVSKHFRRLLLGQAPVPGRGDPLYVQGREKCVGLVTSACRSPAFGETVALGYVRREVGPGEEVRVGGTDGPVARVQLLDLEGDG